MKYWYIEGTDENAVLYCSGRPLAKGYPFNLQVIIDAVMRRPVKPTSPLMTPERLAEIAAMLDEGTADEAVEREIWQAAQAVPVLEALLVRALCLIAGRSSPKAEQFRADVRAVIGGMP